MRAFIAVAERLSFRVAAEQLHVTQPGLSAQIKNLEEFVGTTLLKRGRGQRVSLTQRGKVFLEGAVATLRSADLAVKAVQQHSDVDSGSLSIGFTDDFFRDTPLMDVLADFHKTYPHVIVTYCVDLSYNLVRMLQSQQIDAALLCFPSPMPGANVDIVELPPVPIVVAVPRDHALAGSGAIWMRDLRAERFVLFPTHVVSGFSAHVGRLFSHAGFSPNVVAYANSTDLLAELVSRKVGIALVTRGSVLRNTPDVVLLSIRDSQPMIGTGLLRPVVGSNRFADAFCQHLVRAFKSTTAPASRGRKRR